MLDLGAELGESAIIVTLRAGRVSIDHIRQSRRDAVAPTAPNSAAGKGGPAVGKRVLHQQLQQGWNILRKPAQEVQRSLPIPVRSRQGCDENAGSRVGVLIEVGATPREMLLGRNNIRPRAPDITL